MLCRYKFKTFCIYTHRTKILGSNTSTCQALFTASSLKFVTIVPGEEGAPLLIVISYPPPVTTSSGLQSASPTIGSVIGRTTGISATLWVTMGLTAISGPGLGVPSSIEHVICSNKVLGATFVPQLRLSELPLPIIF
jgi:hypothetical protein